MNNLDRNLSNASTTGAIAQENTNARVDELEDKVLDLQERHEILLLKYEELAIRFNDMIEDRSFNENLGEQFARTGR